MILPCKSQVWSFLAPRLEAQGGVGETGNVPLSAAPYAIQAAFTFFFASSCVLVPLITGRARFGLFLLTLTSTAGVWMNLLLPAVVLIYSKISAPNRTGRMDMPSLLTIGWILLLGVLCLCDGIKQLMDPEHPSGKVDMSQECRRVFDSHHPNMTHMQSMLVF